MSDVRVSERRRVDEALVCPFCRDSVSRSGTVACARRGCGALYHRECWDECSARYGGCAVFGCESRSSREVSAVGYLVRVLRLLVAGFVFPSRVIREIQGDRLRATVGDALRAHARCFLADCRRYTWVLLPVIGIPIVMLAVTASLVYHDAPPELQVVAGAAAAFFLLPFLAAFLLVGVTSGALVLLGGLTNEINALRRADVGGSYLGRRGVDPPAK